MLNLGYSVFRLLTGLANAAFNNKKLPANFGQLLLYEY